jgi:hypothetical protein
MAAKTKCLLPRCEEIISAKIKKGRPKLYCCDDHMRRHYYDQKFGMTDKEKIAVCPNPYCDVQNFVKHHGRQIYCTDACRREHAKIKRLPAVTEEPKKLPHLMACHYCGAEYRSARSSSKFCSTSCRVTFYVQNRMVEWVNRRRTYTEEDYMEDVLDGEVYIECEFNDVDFSGKSMTKAKFINCVINNCCFDKTFFDGVELIDTDFEGHNTFNGAMIRFTKFPALIEEVLDLRGAIVSKMLRRDLLAMHRDKLENRKLTHYGY